MDINIDAARTAMRAKNAVKPANIDGLSLALEGETIFTRLPVGIVRIDLLIS
jgi:hypothetical protein